MEKLLAYDYVALGDEYDENSILFTELQAQGYPVGLLYTGAPVLQPDKAHADHYKARGQLYGNQWAVPTIHDEAFERHLAIVNTLRADGGSGVDFFDTRDDFLKAKEMAINHPAQLVRAVGNCSVASVAQYNHRVREGINLCMTQPIDMNDFLPACFVAAMTRLLVQQDMGDPFLPPVDERALRQYEALSPRVPPVRSEVLREIVRDFYAGIEQRSSRFASFKKQAAKPQKV